MMEELKRDKEELENNIAQLIGNFANKYGVAIEDVNVNSWSGGNWIAKSGHIEEGKVFNVQIRVVL